MMRTAVPGKIAALFIAGAFVVASCGDDDDTDTATPEATSQEAPTTVANATSAPAPTTAAAPSDIYGTPDTASDTTSGMTSNTTEATTAGTTGAAADGDDVIVTTASSSLGDILVGEGGFTVYGFTPDEGGTPTCVDECAASWPPVLLESADVPAGLDPDVFSVVEYPQGGFILRAGDWPLYYFAGDRAAGDVNGQGVNGIWFAVDPTGTLIEE
jgi:predicted lipoprotein with Yx(FWY)xxD motif